MRAAVLESPRSPLVIRDLPSPAALPGALVIRVAACGVCRTDLHIMDGELPGGKLPIVLGHQVVGSVAEVGQGVTGFVEGDLVGVPWLGATCGQCDYCRDGHENLCDHPTFTGFHVDGGFAEMTRADARFCFPIPKGYGPLDAAPLLCAGLIGYRALRMTGEAKRVGFYGFGSAAHVILQAALFQGRTVFAFTRPEDAAGQRAACDLGAAWAGGSDTRPPVPLDAAIIFAPVGALVPAALAAVRKGGIVVCAGIHMSDIPSMPYRLLWEERRIVSVANLTRRDGEEFLLLAPRIPIRTQVEVFPLGRANEALDAVRHGRIEGTAVIDPWR